MTVLTPDDFERSGSWNLVIAAELLRKDGEEAPYRDEGKERYLTDTFHVCRQSGAWYSWAAAKGGLDALSLIKFLRPDYTHEDATRWLVKFLAANPGTGQLEAEDGELSQARREALTSLAKHYLETAEPLAPDGPEVDYLRSRALPGPYPPALRRITQARPGESALIMPLTADGRVTGIQLTYIDALGCKSLVLPNRRRLDIERAGSAVMVLQEPTPGVVDGSTTDPLSRPPDEPWVGEVPPLVTILDNAHGQLHRHIWQPETGTAVSVVWGALTHVVHNPAVNLQVCPKLHITSPMPDCGKTGLLEILAELAPRSELQASYTGSSIFRLVHAGKPTLFLDEADQVLADPKGALSEILNASHRRRSAYVIRSEQDERGAWHVRRFSVWGATAFAGIGHLPPTLASRSIRLELQRALPEQSAKLVHLEDGTSKALTDIRRQLAAWGETQGKLPRPKLPSGFHNRLGNNWRPLLAVAELAGGAWPERIRQAMEEARKMSQRPPLTVRLLTAIQEAFATIPKPPFRLSTGALIAKLLGDEEGGWDEANKGKPINPSWLRERLDGLLDPPGSQRWKDKGSSGDRDDVRGYVRNQFADGFARYLQTGGLPPDSSAPLDPASAEAENPAETADDAGADEPSDVPLPTDDGSSAPTPTPQEPSKSATPDAGLPDEAGGAVESPDNTVRVSLLITQAQKLTLRERGYTDEQIREMPPAVAHRILGLIPGVESADTPPVEPAAAEQPSAAETEKPPENSEAAPRPTARSRRAKPNGPVAESQPVPRLDMPEPSLIDYIEGSIAEEIRQLRAANPSRSIAWIAKQTGQPKSVVREILGNGEGAQ